MVTFNRKLRTPIKVLDRGVVVGRICKSRRRRAEYSLSLQGVYWKVDGSLSLRGGRTGKSFGTVALAKKAAVDALTWKHAQEEAGCV